HGARQLPRHRVAQICGAPCTSQMLRHIYQKRMDCRVKLGTDENERHGKARLEEKTMAYWLLKTEPDVFSWDDQVKRGAKGEPWTGVRNFHARRYLKEMKKGERAVFYHTGEG